MADFSLEFYTDDVGRRRKVSPRDQRTIIVLWLDGHSSRSIAEAFGISTSLVRTICYHVRQGERVYKEPITNARLKWAAKQ